MPPRGNLLVEVPHRILAHVVLAVPLARRLRLKQLRGERLEKTQEEKLAREVEFRTKLQELRGTPSGLQ